MDEVGIKHTHQSNWVTVSCPTIRVAHPYHFYDRAISISLTISSIPIRISNIPSQCLAFNLEIPNNIKNIAPTTNIVIKFKLYFIFNALI